jgi:preprotein translocase subunit SecA
VFEQRLALMHDEEIAGVVTDMRHGLIDDLVIKHLPKDTDREQWNWLVLDLEVRGVLTLDVPIAYWMDEADITPAYVRDYIARVADDWMAAKAMRWGEERLRTVQRRVVMAMLDDLWLRHVQRVELMRRAAPLRAHGRRDPLTEFKIEAFHLFELMLAQLRRNVTAATMRIGFDNETPAEPDGETDVVVPDHLVSALH